MNLEGDAMTGPRHSTMVIPHEVPLVVEEASQGETGTHQGAADASWAGRVPESLQFDPTLESSGDWGLSEPQAVAHFTKLSQKNFGNDTALYPLGSCTMKHNPKACDEVSSWSMVNLVHPDQDPRTVQGTLAVMHELAAWLGEITGMDDVSLQPAAGAQGEFLGCLLARAYHESRSDGDRDEIILPDTAHGTNPATAGMAGYKVVEIPSRPDGRVDLEALKAALSPRTALFMLTNPNTLGIFESEIQEIAREVHKAGALLYYDGANLNAIQGVARPGDMGFDIVHMNLHKTYAVPHGGGGPGAGPVGVKAHLAPFLPVPRVVKEGGQYALDWGDDRSIGKLKGHFGQSAALIRAYSYIALLGAEGVRRAAEIAVLNANYVKRRLEGVLDFPHPGPHKHEFVASARNLKRDRGITAGDVAKRLLDWGIHAPTVYFPLIVPEAIMFEPTESESQAELDRFVDVMRRIATQESVELVRGAPHTTPVRRLDEATAARKPVLRWHTLDRIMHLEDDSPPTGALPIPTA